MSRARDNANLGAQAGSGLDASDITSGALPVGVTGGSGLNALSASNLSAGTVPDARMPNLTGDITTSEGAVATTIATDAVDIAMLSATGTADATTYLRGDNSWQTAGSTSASDLDSGTLAVARMASGTVIQTVTDTYDPDASVTVTTTGDDILGSNLEVTITPSSTSNTLLLHCFTPDVHNSGVSGAALHAGFRYHADFSASDGTILGEREFIADHQGYLNYGHYLLTQLHFVTPAAAPVTTAIKIRPWYEAVTGSCIMFANNSVSDRGVACLIVQEIKA